MATTLPVQIIVSAVDKATKTMKGIGNELGQQQGKWQSFQNAIAGGIPVFAGMSTAAVTALGAVGVAVGAAGTRYARLEETLEVVRKTVGLTTDEIAKMREELLNANLMGAAATETMLTFVQSGLGKLTDFEKFTLMAKDFAAAIGVSSRVGVESFTKAIGTLRPELLDQFRLQFNLNEVYKASADEIGKTVSEMTGQEKRLALLNFLYSEHEKTVKGVYKQTYDTANKAISSVKDATVALADVVGVALEPAIKEVAIVLRDAVQGAVKWVQDNKAVIQDWGKTLGDVAKKAVELMKVLFDFLLNNKEFIVGFFVAIGVGAAIALVALIKFAAVGIAIMGAITLAVGLLIKAWNADFLGIRTTIEFVVETFKWFFNTVMGLYKLFIEGDITRQLLVALGLNEDSPLITGLMFLREMFVQQFEAIRVVLEAFVAVFKFVWENVVFPLLLLAQAIILRIMVEIGKIFQAQSSFIKDNVIIPIFTAIKNFLVMTWEAIKGAIVAVLQFLLNDSTLTFEQIRDNVVNSITNLWERLKDLGGKIFDALVDPFRRALDKIREIGEKIREAADKINPFHQESPSLVDQVEAGIQRIKDAYGTLGDVGIPAVAGAGVGAAVPGGAATPSPSNITLNVHIGMYAGNPSEKREVAREIWSSIGEIARAEKITPEEMIGLEQ